MWGIYDICFVSFYHHNCSIIKTSFCMLLEEVVSWETPQTDHPTWEDGACQHLWVCVPSSSRSSSHLGPWDRPQDALHPPLTAAVLWGEGQRAEQSQYLWPLTCSSTRPLLLLLGGHRRILRLLLHDEELLGHLPFMSLSHFHALFITSLNLSVESILLKIIFLMKVY